MVFEAFATEALRLDDGGQGVGQDVTAPLVVGRDPTPNLRTTEGILDAVALAIKALVVSDWFPAFLASGGMQDGALLGR